MNNMVGNNNDEMDNHNYRYFYGLKRNDDGELFLTRVDINDPDAVLEINAPGDPLNNFNDFQEGQDFFEGRDSRHDLIYKNLNFEQLRWDSKRLVYYINDQGELIQRRGRDYTHEDNISSDDTNKKATGTPPDNSLYL
jgi:hypothetical protein